jgi:hypothetical protein
MLYEHGFAALNVATSASKHRISLAFYFHTTQLRHRTSECHLSFSS